MDASVGSGSLSALSVVGIAVGVALRARAARRAARRRHDLADLLAPPAPRGGRATPVRP